MIPTSPVWSLPLSEAPLIHNMGVGVHDPSEPGRYRLTDLWCLHFYNWHGSITLDGATLPIEPGCVGIIPPGVEHQYVYRGESVHVYAHFKLPGTVAVAVSAPAMQGLGERYEPLRQMMLDAVGWHPSAPRRAEARVWDVLWQVVSTSTEGAELVSSARRIIETDLADKLSVEAIARRLGCSHNHLTRLFRQELGLTVVAYIRTRRVERARRLLEYTIIPIKAIAAEVGIHNLQQFNKIVRHELGRPPRTVRRRSR